tara:strand:+ start:4810 stop:5586 length:777 start_codon:yes stop_codon:yes gene_type:complete
MSAGELNSDFPMEAVWLVSVDGKTIRRVTPLIPASYTKASAPSLYSRSLRWVRWAPDGKSLWFYIHEGWTDSDGWIQIIRTSWNINITTGKIKSFWGGSGCTMVNKVTPQRNGSLILAQLQDCVQTRDGFYLFDANNPGQAPVRIQDPSGNIKLEDIVTYPGWFGSSVYLNATAIWNGSHQREEGIVGYNTKDGTFFGVYKKSQGFGDFYPSYDGKVYVYSNGSETDRRLFMCDWRTSQQNCNPKEIVSGGVNDYVSW